MNDEPNYEFVKGLGWIVAPPVPFRIFESAYRGRAYRLTVLLRPPKTGERCWSVSLSDPEHIYKAASRADVRPYRGFTRVWEDELNVFDPLDRDIQWACGWVLEKGMRPEPQYVTLVTDWF